MRGGFEAALLAVVLTACGGAPQTSGGPNAHPTTASSTAPSCPAETQDLTLTGAVSGHLTCLHLAGGALGGSTYVCSSDHFQAGDQTDLLLGIFLPLPPAPGPANPDESSIQLAPPVLSKSWTSGRVGTTLTVSAVQPVITGTVDADLRSSADGGVVHISGRWACAAKAA